MKLLFILRRIFYDVLQKIREKISKKLEDLFENFLLPKRGCLGISSWDQLNTISYTIHRLNEDNTEEFNKKLSKVLEPNVFYIKNRFYIEKEKLFELIPVMYLEAYYAWRFDSLFHDEASETPDWDDMSEDFRSAFEKFYKSWDKCSNKDFQFEYAEELFQIIYEEYPRLCIDAFPVVLFIFTDSYFAFCRICRNKNDKRGISEKISDEMRSRILSLFINRICGDDFQYYLFSLMDIKVNYYSESSFYYGRKLCKDFLKKISQKVQKMIDDPKALHIKYKKLIEKFHDEYCDFLDNLKDKYELPLNDTYRTSPLSFSKKKEALEDLFFNEMKEGLINIVKKYMDPQYDIMDEARSFLNEIDSLFDHIYARKETSFHIPFENRMEMEKTTKKLITDVILEKFNKSAKKIGNNVAESQLCKNLKVLWRFMHDFSTENGTDNRWADYDIDFSLYVLDNATGWIESMIYSQKKELPAMFYPNYVYHINLRMPTISYYILSSIYRCFDIPLNSSEDSDQETYSSLLRFFENMVKEINSFWEECSDCFNADTFDGNIPPDVFNIKGYYDDIWSFSDFPSIEDLTFILTEYIYNLDNNTAHQICPDIQ